MTGVDFFAQPDYCGDEFIQGEAIKYALEHAHEYDFVHASPPCQLASAITSVWGRDGHKNLVPPTRRVLLKSRTPFVIENVEPMERVGPMRRDLTLCGEAFGLRVIRHRIFETGGWLPRQLKHVPHNPGGTKGAGHDEAGTERRDRRIGYYEGVYGRGYGSNKEMINRWGDAMGIDWITDIYTMAQAIPPAYTQYIMNEFLGITSTAEEIRSAYQGRKA